MKLVQLGNAFALAVGLAASAASHATAPTAVGMIGGSFFDFTFEAYNYTSSAKVGTGAVDMNKLFFFEEKTVGNVQSWYMFFDPTCISSVDALITFSSNITGIDRSTAALKSSDPTFGIGNPLYTDVYATRKFTGLDKRDFALYKDNQLEIHWKASDPGDHIRVYTAAVVPEPQTYAMLLAGLGVLAATVRRRRQTGAAVAA